MTAEMMNITLKNTISGGDKLRKPFTIETRFAGPADIPCARLRGVPPHPGPKNKQRRVN